MSNHTNCLPFTRSCSTGKSRRTACTSKPGDGIRRLGARVQKNRGLDAWAAQSSRVMWVARSPLWGHVQARVALDGAGCLTAKHASRRHPVSQTTVQTRGLRVAPQNCARSWDSPPTRPRSNKASKAQANADALGLWPQHAQAMRHPPQGAKAWMRLYRPAAHQVSHCPRDHLPQAARWMHGLARHSALPNAAPTRVWMPQDSRRFVATEAQRCQQARSCLVAAAH